MGLGYALLSLCLFRMLSFLVVFIPGFFVFYMALGFPVGAYLAARVFRGHNGWESALGRAVGLLPVAAGAVLLMGPLANRGTDFVPTTLPLLHHPAVTFTWGLLLPPLICLPFFVLWGGAEFIGFQAALNHPRLKPLFYVIAIVSLLAAFVIGHWALPGWGLLKTVVLVLFFCLLALFLLKSGGNGKILLGLGFCLALWYGAGQGETTYTTGLFPQPTRRILAGTHDPHSLQPLQQPARTKLLKTDWGKYCHLAFIHWQHPQKSPEPQIICCYNGLPVWGASPAAGENPRHPFGRIAFDGLQPDARVCIIGAGGGAQVAQAIAAGARTVVAVDVIPEIFSLLQDELAWINGGIYRHPRVQTVAMDGLRYIEESRDRFDRIVLAATESSGRLLVSLREPDQRLYTLESFQAFHRRLKPDGVIVICRTVDINQRLFTACAATLKAAGLKAVGFSRHLAEAESFMLFAATNKVPDQFEQVMQAYLQDRPGRLINFQQTPPKGPVNRENSPWISGLAGTFLPALATSVYWWGTLLLAVVLATWAILRAKKRKNSHPDDTLASETAYGLAALLTGVNAICLESGLIFWFIMNLFNPLAAFFAGSAVFLLLWGISNSKPGAWIFLTILGLAGIAGLLVIPRWSCPAFFSFLLITAFGSGFCFSRLALVAPGRLLPLILFDAGGTLFGVVLGVGIPFFYGFNTFFALLPWISLLTLAITIFATVPFENRSRQQA